MCIIRLAACVHRGPNFVMCVEENDITQAGWGENFYLQSSDDKSKEVLLCFKFQAKVQSLQIGACLFPFSFLMCKLSH